MGQRAIVLLLSSHLIGLSGLQLQHSGIGSEPTLSAMHHLAAPPPAWPPIFLSSLCVARTAHPATVRSQTAGFCSPHPPALQLLPHHWHRRGPGRSSARSQVSQTVPGVLGQAPRAARRTWKVNAHTHTRARRRASFSL